MSLFHDDPFDNKPDDEESVEVDTEVPQLTAEDVAAIDEPNDDSPITEEAPHDDNHHDDTDRPRKRSRSPSAEQGDGAGLLADDGSGSPADDGAAEKTIEGEETGEATEEEHPRVDVAGPNEAFLDVQRQHTMAELMARSTALEHQLQSVTDQKSTLERALNDTKVQLERRSAELHAMSAAVASNEAESTKVTAAMAAKATEWSSTAATESRISLSAAERGYREQHYWKQQSEFLQEALRWQQRSAALWREAFECSQSKSCASTKGVDVALAEPEVATPHSSLEASTQISSSIHSAHAWLASLTPEDDAVKVPVEKRGLLHQILQAAAEHVVEVAKAHDGLAVEFVSARRKYHQLQQTVGASALYDLEPRVALLREMIDRQLTGTFVSPEDKEMRLKLKGLQDRNSLLEAVVASHVAKVDHVPNAQAVVPQVLKERIARCEALEKEVSELRQEVSYLQRIRGSEGLVDIPLADGGSVSKQSRGKDELLEECAQQWLERAQMATDAYVQSCDRSEDRRAVALTTLQLRHAEATGQYQAAVIEQLQNDIVLLKSQLGACHHLCSVVQTLPTATGATPDLIECVHHALEDVKRCAGADRVNDTSFSVLEGIAAGVNHHLEAALVAHGESVQAMLLEGQDRYRRVVAFLTDALNRSDAALCESLGLEHRPLAALPHDSFEVHPAPFVVRPCAAAATVTSSEVHRIVQEQAAAHKSAIDKLSTSFQSQIEFHQQRWAWLLTQDGNDGVKALADALEELRSTKAALSATEEQRAEASKGAARASQLQRELTEKQARVTSLEAQLKISQEASSKFRQENALLAKEHAAATSTLEAQAAALQQTISALEASLDEARQAVVAAQEDAAAAWAANVAPGGDDETEMPGADDGDDNGVAEQLDDADGAPVDDDGVAEQLDECDEEPGAGDEAEKVDEEVPYTPGDSGEEGQQADGGDGVDDHAHDAPVFTDNEEHDALVADGSDSAVDADGHLDEVSANAEELVEEANSTAHVQEVM